MKTYLPIELEKEIEIVLVEYELNSDYEDCQYLEDIDVKKDAYNILSITSTDHSTQRQIKTYYSEITNEIIEQL